jgi:hypothetical protein
MTKEQRHKWYADSLRNKYNKILAQNGYLVDTDYENLISDAEKCISQDVSCRGMIFDVLEEFDKRK